MSASTKSIKDWPSKKPRLAAWEGDFISNIPDDVLSHIFSRMPIKDAVRTSTLSKDWKYKWTSLYKLIVTGSHWESNPQSFNDFLNRTLPSIQCLRFVQLWCHPIYSNESDLQRWFSAVLEHDLETFKAVTSCCLALPCSVLNSTSLRQLSFSNRLGSVNVDVKNIAPKLTNLYLRGVEIANGSPTLTFTFPVLETLTLERCNWLNARSVEIYAPSLTELSITTSNREKYDYSMVIVAPGITSFHTRGIPKKISMNRSSVLSAYLCGELSTRADLHIRRGIIKRVRKLVNKFTSLEELAVHGSLLKVSLSSLPICRHDKLRRLTIIQECSNKLLLELLHAAPSLEFLSMHVYRQGNYNYEALKSIPTCIPSCLEEVVFTGFENKAPQYNLVKFFFKNAEQLKSFRIFEYVAREPEEELIERLSTIPRCSSYTIIDVSRSHASDSIYRLRSLMES